ncbi:MFS transporter [Sphingomonas canadensis]|uniref:MFS transporter n=1 Tax=Sphingomonas canadensis TaxID=1219257 RepID=A0ABW3H8M1_9SPHN|nr:MFS transporter [Sphingomonas canadensis]MCW3837553.1 MFS transporter [Sphingomonas canadensis]
MSGAEAKSPPPLGGRAAWYALTLVSLVQAMSMVDRQILAILVPRIKADLHIADAEMGLLYGTVFALFYAIFSLPLGRLADGWIRTRLLSISILGWSAMTALAGFANSFATLAVSRLGVGIGEASAQPAGMSLLSDSFPKEKRGIIGAAMSAAIALGLGGALVLGGFTADWWDRTWPAGQAPFGFKGWQAAFLAASIPGIVIGILIGRMPEPRRGAADGLTPHEDPHPFAASWRTLAAILPVTCWLNLARLRAGAGAIALNAAGLIAIVLAMYGVTLWTGSLRPNAPPLMIGGMAISGNALQWSIAGFGCYVLLNWLQSLRLTDRPAFVLILRSPAALLVLAVASLQTVINYGVMGWTPAYLIKHFHQSPTQVGLMFGTISAAIGILGPVIAGPVADWTHKRVPGGRLYVTLGSLALSPFFALATYRAEDIGGFYLWFSLFSILLTLWLPSIYATLMDLVLPRMRGVMMSFYILVMTILGLGVGPFWVGMASDLNGGDLGSAILSVFWLAPAIVVLTALAIWRLPRDEAAMLDRAREAGEAV